MQWVIFASMCLNLATNAFEMHEQSGEDSLINTDGAPYSDCEAMRTSAEPTLETCSLHLLT